jgi:hypothetical protein
MKWNTLKGCRCSNVGRPKSVSIGVNYKRKFTKNYSSHFRARIHDIPSVSKFNAKATACREFY